MTFNPFVADCGPRKLAIEVVDFLETVPVSLKSCIGVDVLISLAGDEMVNHAFVITDGFSVVEAGEWCVGKDGQVIKDCGSH